MIPECFIVKYRVSYKNIISVRTYIYTLVYVIKTFQYVYTRDVFLILFEIYLHDKIDTHAHHTLKIY